LMQTHESKWRAPAECWQSFRPIYRAIKEDINDGESVVIDNETMEVLPDVFADRSFLYWLSLIPGIQIYTPSKEIILFKFEDGEAVLMPISDPKKEADYQKGYYQ
jgi:hypothetical protein